MDQPLYAAEEPLFDIDDLEGAADDGSDAETQRNGESHRPFTSRIVLSIPISTAAELHHGRAPDASHSGSPDKGKGVSRPLDIFPKDAAASPPRAFAYSPLAGITSDITNAFPSSLASASTSTSSASAAFAFSPSATPGTSYWSDAPSASYQTRISTPGSSCSGDSGAGMIPSDSKGKAPDTPPFLQPLQFSPLQLEQGETNWPDTDLGRITTTMSDAINPYPQDNTGDSGPSNLDSRPFPRPRSFSSLSAFSTKSVGSQSIFKKFRLRKPSTSDFARKFLSRKRDPKADPVFNPVTANISSLESGRPPSLELAGNARAALRSLYDYPVGVDRQLVSRHYSYPNSFPFPATSPSALVPFVENELSSPIQVAKPPDYFNLLLPREIKIFVFKWLALLHEADHRRALRGGTWTAHKATSNKHRYVGKDKALLELLKLSRVCKAWQDVILDGQLWSALPLKSFPKAKPEVLTRVAASAKSFIRTFDLTGHTHLNATTLLEVTKSICIDYQHISGTSFATQLTTINFIGCTTLTSHSLHYLLTHSPLLTKIRLRGLSIVSNHTCEVIATHCPRVSVLDLNRCRELTADGVDYLASPAEQTGLALPLKSLRIAGVRRMNTAVMGKIGKNLPDLETLDLNGARELRAAHIEALVACEDDECGAHIATLTSREAGHDPADPTKYRRRVLTLRHLALSYCPLLTDAACSHLAHAVPQLECLELAGVGDGLREEGLVALLKTTPGIRKLDLEEACEVTDSVIEAITPEPPIEPSRRGHRQEVEGPGSKLEHLILSYAVNVTSDAVLGLIRACTRLKTLELDNTRVSGSVIKEFIKLSRRRQAQNAELVAIDCRGVSEGLIKEHSDIIRTRKGQRTWDARHLSYLDGRDNENLGVGFDECDEKRVVLKTFYSWQTVDAVEKAREKAKEKRNKGSRRGHFGRHVDESGRGSIRWWGASNRQGFDPFNNTVGSGQLDRDGCTIM